MPLRHHEESMRNATLNIRNPKIDIVFTYISTNHQTSQTNIYCTLTQSKHLSQKETYLQMEYYCANGK